MEYEMMGINMVCNPIGYLSEDIRGSGPKQIEVHCKGEE
jgi:hypothetical protein